MIYAILIAVLLVAFAFLAQGIMLSKKDFFCPQCSHRFRRKWYQLIFLTHYENEYSVRCPECGKKYTEAVDR